MTIRLFEWQVEKLKKHSYPVEVLRRAYSRFQRGDFTNVVQMDENEALLENCTTLKAFTIRKRFPVSDSEMRTILSMHWNNPDMKWKRTIETELKKVDAEIDELFSVYANRKYIVEVEE